MRNIDLDIRVTVRIAREDESEADRTQRMVPLTVSHPARAAYLTVRGALNEILNPGDLIVAAEARRRDVENKEAL